MPEPKTSAVIPIPLAYGMAILASLVFGVAIVPGNGQYQIVAVGLVVAGLLLLGLMLVKQWRMMPVAGRDVTSLLGLMWMALFVMAWAVRHDDSPLASAHIPWTTGRIAQSSMLVLLVSYLPALFMPGLKEKPQWRHVRFALLAVCVLVGGWIVVHVSPQPAIDVWHLQQDGARLLSIGENPYPVVAVEDTGSKPAGAVPYAYPPLQLYATLPAFLLGGDVRYTMVLAVVVAGCAIRGIALRARRMPALAQDAPALALWLSPKLFLILEQAWVDVVGLALVCCAVWAYRGGRRTAAAILFGLAFAAKQPMVWLIPLLALLPGSTRRRWMLALGTMAASVLPFILWDWQALYDANVRFLVQQPPRPEALTLLNWFYLQTGLLPPTAIGPFLAAAAAAVAVWRMPRSVTSFALAATVVLAVLFAFSKIAYANYYFLVAGLAALTAAVILDALCPASQDSTHQAVTDSDGASSRPV